MRCRHCGTENPEGSLLCQGCGAALTADPQGQRTKRALPPIVWLLAFFVVVVSVFAIVFSIWRSRRLILIDRLLPSEAPVFVIADGIRGLEIVREMTGGQFFANVLDELEKGTGISLEKDIAPWVGQVGVVALKSDQTNEDGVALVLEVRNWEEFQKCADKVKAKGTYLIDWKEDIYQGVKIQRAVLEGDLPVGLGLLKTYAVVGVGKGAIEKVIDVWQGRKFSVRERKEWMIAKSQLPKKPLVTVVMDTKMVTQSLGEEINGLGQRAPLSALFSEYAETISAIALTVEERSIGMKTISVAASDRLRRRWQEAAKNFAPVTGEIFNLLPDEAVGAIYFSSLAQWWRWARDSIRAMLPTAEEKRGWDEAVGEMKDLISVMERMTREMGVALLWGEKLGFGFLIMGQTSDEKAAAEAAQTLSRFVEEKTGDKVEMQDGVFFVPASQQVDPTFSVLLCWTARGQWLIVASHPEWLKEVTGERGKRLATPLRHTLFGLVAHFQWLPSLLKKIEKEREAQFFPPSERALISQLRQMKLEEAVLEAWMDLDPNGNWSAMTLQLRNWAWKDGLKAISEVGAQVQTDAKAKADQALCQTHLRTLSLAVVMYTQDWDDRLPLAPTWADRLAPYLRSEEPHICPSRTYLKRGYAFNRRLSGMNFNLITHPADTVQLFESNLGGSNPSDFGESWIVGGVHFGGNNTGFVDGHIKWYPWKKKESLKFRP
ncbi:MAG: DUF3352 domain-containing protein [Armatimonadetes bacterium]|nr:DUF3352 domain-containing protein [Armatimonadota bacterium]MDW8121910.1 DUF3352 domain-containing protein [Armatimonadota bacterium]